jgi:ribose transport system substrate-binding protein
MIGSARPRLVRLAAAAVTTAIVAVLVTACSSSSPSTESGGSNGQPSARKLSDINIALFYSPTDNAYVNAFKQTADSVATQEKVKLTQFASNDASTQVGQIQSAIASGRYNAWIVAATDPVQECDLIKQQAMKIPVLILNQGLCGNDTFTPSTISFVGGQTRAVYKQFFGYVADHNPQGGNAILLTGPNLNYNTINADTEFQAMVDAHPAFKVVANQQIDYTSATAFDATTNLLRAHPETNMVITNYADMTVGAARAIEQLGLTKQIKVYDLGASNQVMSALKAGQVEMSYPLLPVVEMTTAIQAMARYWQGEQIPQVYDIAAQLNFPGKPFITAANAAQFTPAY